MNFKDYNNEIFKLLEVTKYTSNNEERKEHMMLAMDKMLVFGNDENIQHQSSSIKLFKVGVNKAKEFAISDSRFEKYISAFEKLVKKHKKPTEQEKKQQRVKRELARLEWTMLS